MSALIACSRAARAPRSLGGLGGVAGRAERQRHEIVHVRRHETLQRRSRQRLRMLQAAGIARAAATARFARDRPGMQSCTLGTSAAISWPALERS